MLRQTSPNICAGKGVCVHFPYFLGQRLHPGFNRPLVLLPLMSTRPHCCSDSCPDASLNLNNRNISKRHVAPITQSLTQEREYWQAWEEVHASGMNNLVWFVGEILERTQEEEEETQRTFEISKQLCLSVCVCVCLPGLFVFEHSFFPSSYPLDAGIVSTKRC